jgi:HEPN superfamily protein
MPESRFHTEIQRARAAIMEAELAQQPSDRYVAAHLAALRVAAILLAARADPAESARRTRPRNAWRMLSAVAPEFAEWAAFFAATEGKRDAVRAGATTIVSAREADDLVRDAQTFLGLVERRVTELARGTPAENRRPIARPPGRRRREAGNGG